MQIRKDTTLIFLQLREAINVPQVITYVLMVALSMRSFAAAETAICQITRRQCKSHSLLTFDAGAEKPIFACSRITFSTWISTRGHRYPRSVVFNYSRIEWLFRDVTAFSWNFLVTKSRILRSAQLSSGMSSRHVYSCVLTSVKTTLRNAKICSSNLHEVQVNKYCINKKVLPCDIYR